MNKVVTFGLKREDLLFDFDLDQEEIFAFCAYGGTGLSSSDPMIVEAEGFDFRGTLKPVVVINDSFSYISEKASISASELQVSILITDYFQRSRRVIFERQVDSIKKQTPVKIDLRKQDGLDFRGGLEIRCIVTRSSSTAPSASFAWSKSQIILERTYTMRTSTNDALFDINWHEFADDVKRADVLYYVRWDDLDVSSAASVDSVTVIANESLRSQFLRLEGNSSFGHLPIRMMAHDILSEIISRTLLHCDLSSDPAPGSLHERVKALLALHKFDFDRLSQMMQSGNSGDMSLAAEDVKCICQAIYRVGTELRGMKFGGFRAQ